MLPESEQHEVVEIIEPQHISAELIFSLAAFLFAVVMWLNIDNELRHIDGASIFRQPGLWSLTAIYGMLGFGVFNLVTCVRRNFNSDVGASMVPELFFWVKSIEYVGWFLVYVLIVPKLGYLPATLVFCAVLTYRLGYRNAKFLGISVGVSIVVVVFFKSFLQVKIPSGAIYEYLPSSIRSFFLVYL